MPENQEYWFDHEKLDVYRRAIDFIAWLSGLIEGAVRFGDVKDQLDRASTSIALNIAEGNGKYTPKDRCRFFDIAHASRSSAPPAWTFSWPNRNLRPTKYAPEKNRFRK